MFIGADYKFPLEFWLNGVDVDGYLEAKTWVGLIFRRPAIVPNYSCLCTNCPHNYSEVRSKSEAINK